MSNGRHALKGFEYQATVNLNLLLKYFHESVEDVIICPEGDDDLVVTPINGCNCHFYQVKKPKEFDTGELKIEPWSLADVAQSLLPGTFDRLNGNLHLQTWVLGDDMESDVQALLSAGHEAPASMPTPYLRTLHLLARERSSIIPAQHQARRQLLNWKPPSDATISSMISGFRQEAISKGIQSDACDKYEQVVNDIHAALPDVLERTFAETMYGADEKIRERIQRVLQDRYNLDWETIKNTLVPALRNYVYTVSSELGKTIRKTDFEAEIRNVWPRMTMVCEPPALEEKTLRRSALIQDVVARIERGPLEITGISGSGKTTLASEIMEYLKTHESGINPLYVAVQSNRSFKDVIAGVAFHLRRLGMEDLFAIATRNYSSDERAIIEIAEKLCSSTLQILIIIDLVDGICSDSFAADMARFLAKLTSGTFRLLVMSQESSFRMLSPLQRKTLTHPEPLDIPGFNFEEFVVLAGIVNANPHNRADLWDIYNHFTADRFSGLHARLANSIASCETLEEMKRLTEMSPEGVLEEADRIRYQHLTENLRPTADKLLCFMLPFRENEAIDLFPADRVNETVRELIRHGLLRQLDNQRFEFHETIRKGLCKYISPTVSSSTHKALSDHYLQRGKIPAAIYHMEESGQTEEARQIGRQSFLEGRHRNELEAYITKHHLLSAADIVEMLAKETDVDKYYMLPQMLKNIGHEDTAVTLLQLARRDSDRFDNDYRWAWKITEAILVCDPNKLLELVLFGLEVPTTQTEHDRLHCVIQGIRRPTTQFVDQRLLDFFNKQHETIKSRLVALLLMDKRRERLAPALSFLSTYEPPDNHRGNRAPDSLMKNLLKFETPTAVREFLAALPVPVQVSQMMIHRSALLGRLEGLIWAERHVIQPQCIEILEQQSSEEPVLLNALRVLVFLQDKRAIHLAEQNARKSDQMKSFAAFIPSFFLHAVEPAKYRSRVLDTQLPLDDRVVAFSILSGIGENIDLLLNELTVTDTAFAEAWEYFVVMNSVQRPCKSAIPILEKMLMDSNNEDRALIFALAVCKLGELSGDDVTDFLIRMIESPSPNISYMASLSLQQRRSRLALPALLVLCRRVKDPDLVQLSLVAAIASGPNNAESFADIWPRFPKAAIWRCILANRLRAVSEADWLVQVATDTTQHWQLRRLAILAASSLPFTAALEKIYPAVIKEKSSFTIDDHPSLLMHSLMVPLILEEREGLHRYFLRSRESFVEFWGDIFQTRAEGNIYPVADSMGKRSADWLFDRLAFHGWPNNQNAQDLILNELHIPILHAAVLRGLRLTGHHDLIEMLLPKADTEWLLIRALCEWAKQPGRNHEDINRIRGLLTQNTFGERAYLNNCLNNISSNGEPPIRSDRSGDDKGTDPTSIDYDDIMKALEIGQLRGKPPYVLVGLSAEQFSRLVKELDPKRDYEVRLVPTDPKLVFSQGGPSIKGTKHESLGRHRSVREAIRPALAAANNFGVNIPWHTNLLGRIQSYGRYEHIAEQYIVAFLASIVAKDDSDCLCAELEKYPDLIMPKLSKIAKKLPARKLIDERIVPLLRIYANAGNDDMLESLCTLASCVKNASIDPVLSELFLRWYHRFNRSEKLIQHRRNLPLWRAFNNLRKHPRFKNIPDYDLRIMEVLGCNLYWIDRDYIIEALSESPRCYTKIETILMQKTSFEHFLRDDIDKLDEMAQRLFIQVDD